MLWEIYLCPISPCPQKGEATYLSLKIDFSLRYLIAETFQSCFQLVSIVPLLGTYCLYTLGFAHARPDALVGRVIHIKALQAFEKRKLQLYFDNPESLPVGRQGLNVNNRRCNRWG